MSKFNEYVISLVKLTVPGTIHLQRITIAATLGSQQVFLSQPRVIRNQKVNLFREYLFLNGQPSTLSFEVYEVSDSNSKILLKQLKVTKKDLASISSRPTNFVSSDCGFQLCWDSWLFSEMSEDLNSITDRNYSELDLPFENNEEPYEITFLKKCQISTEATLQDILKKEDFKKRLILTRNTSLKMGLGDKKCSGMPQIHRMALNNLNVYDEVQ